jgi:hypothetical protein
VAPARGFLLTASERHYRGDERAFSVGSEVQLSMLTLRVLELTADGRPAAVEARFALPLDSSELSLLYFRDGALERFLPPAPGETRTLPAEGFFDVLANEMARD